MRATITLCAAATCAVLVLGVLPAPAATSRWIFVVNQGDDTVSVVDGDLEREVKVLHVGSTPQGIALRTNPPLIAVANSKARFLSLIDPIARETLPEQIPTGFGPEAVAFSADGTQLFATNYYDRTVTVSAVDTRALVGDPIAFEGTPRHLLLSPDGKYMLALLHDEVGQLAVIDVATRRVERTVPAGRFPNSLVFSPDGKRLFVGSFDTGTATVVDVATWAPGTTFRIESGMGLNVHPTKPLLYNMLNFDGEVLVFDYAAEQVVTKIAVGGSPTQSPMTADGRFLYVVNSEASNLVKVDTESNTTALRIAVGADPQAAVIFEPAHASLGAPAIAAAVAIAAALAALVLMRRRPAAN